MNFVEAEWEVSCLICIVGGWIQWRAYVTVVVGRPVFDYTATTSFSRRTLWVTSCQTVRCRNPADIRLKKKEVAL
jgi:hypothetical protein